MNFFRAMNSLWRRLIGRPAGKELDEEIQSHLQIEIDEKIEEGMTPEGARYAAQRKFGNSLLYKEQVEDVWRFAWLDSLLRDIRYAFRSFRNSPGFALAVIGTLALGLGVLAASVSVFNAMVLQPFAVRDPYSLYAFIGWGPSKGWVFGGPTSYGWSRFKDFRCDNPVFSEILGYQNGTAPVEKKSASLQAVTGNYFTMLGGRICMGRALLESDEKSGERVAVASYAAWKSRFGADPQILGKTMRLRDKPVEIVGIACPEFNGPQKDPIDFWVSLALSRDLADVTVEYLAGPINKKPVATPIEFPKLQIIGRLKPGFTEASAEEALLAYGRQAYRSWVPPWGSPPESTKIQKQATSFPLNRDTVRIFLPAFIAFGLVLLIACANVSNMILARGLARQREIGIRISLGAGRARMIRQLLTESLLLAIPAALVAFGAAHGIIRAGYWLQTAILPASGVGRVFGLSKTFGAKIDLANSLPDLGVLTFLLAAALVTTLLFGLVPAIQTTRSRLVEANRGEFESGYRPARLRSALVIAQSTLCALLLILAGVSLRNEMRISSQDLGLDISGVFSISVSNRVNRQTVLDRLSSLPGTDSIGTSNRPPLDTVTGMGGFPGKWTGENGTVEFAYTHVIVSPEYFDVYRIGVKGSKLAVNGHPVMANMADWTSVIVSESFARRLWPSGNALGQSTVLELPLGNTGRTMRWNFQVVGIAADSVYDLYDSTGAPKPNRMLVYELFPLTSWTSAKQDDLLPAPFSRLLVRMEGNPGIARRLLQKILEETTQGDTDFEILSAEDQWNRFLYPYRALAAIAVFLGALSFLLTGTGVFGMLSYVVTQRRKELGIRVALGAGKARVTGMVLTQSLRLAAAGSILGAVAALGAARVASQYVYQINLFDAVGYAMGLSLVIIVSLVASWIPVRKAVNLDPARTLHCD